MLLMIHTMAMLRSIMSVRGTAPRRLGSLVSFRTFGTWNPRFIPPAQSPTFNLKADDVSILYSPQQFFETLKQEIAAANERVSIASLYLGDGDLESTFVDVLYQKAHENPGMQFNFLFDKSRGTRGPKNTVTQLQRLIRSNDARLSLLLLPQVERYESFLPPRWIEGVGVQHMKLYVFDDTVIVSGANLSKDYFTNRQDRYWCFRNAPEMAGFFHSLVGTLTTCAHSLSKAGELLPPTSSLTSYTINSILQDGKYDRLVPNAAASDADVLISPLMQLGTLNIRHDEILTSHLLESLSEEDRGYMATGYFNLPELYQQQILSGVSKVRWKPLMSRALSTSTKPRVCTVGCFDRSS